MTYKTENIKTLVEAVKAIGGEKNAIEALVTYMTTRNASNVRLANDRALLKAAKAAVAAGSLKV